MTNNKQRSLDWFNNVESRSHPWPGLNWLTTMIFVPDVKLATDIYEEVFGFVPIFEMPDPNDEQINIFTRLRYRGANFTLNKEEEFNFSGKSPINSKIESPFMFYIYVDDIKNILQHVVKYNFEILEEPHEEKWGDLKSRVRDPFGYIWEIAQKIV